MRDKDKKKASEDYFVDFKGAKLDKIQANRVGVGVLFGILGIIICYMLPIREKSIWAYLILAFSFFVGYFVVAPILFKEK